MQVTNNRPNPYLFYFVYFGNILSMISHFYNRMSDLEILILSGEFTFSGEY